MYNIIVKQIKITESPYNYTESSCEPIYGCLHHKYILQNCRLHQHCWICTDHLGDLDTGRNDNV